jgi:hypothetical protein
VLYFKQGDSGGTVTTLGGDTVIVRKILYEHVSNFEWFVTERELFEYINTKAL